LAPGVGAADGAAVPPFDPIVLCRLGRGRASCVVVVVACVAGVAGAVAVARAWANAAPPSWDDVDGWEKWPWLPLWLWLWPLACACV
jgi:hypothetical protein